MAARIAGLIGGAIQGAVLGVVFLGLGWVLNATVHVPLEYSLFKLSVAPLLAVAAFFISLSQSAPGLAIWFIAPPFTSGGGPKDYRDVIRSIWLFGLVGMGVDSVRLLMHIEASQVPTAVGVFIGLLLGLGGASRVDVWVALLCTLPWWLFATLPTDRFGPTLSSATSTDPLVWIGTAVVWFGLTGAVAGVVSPPELPAPRGQFRPTS